MTPLPLVLSFIHIIMYQTCQAQVKSPEQMQHEAPISEYVLGLYQDRSGHVWMGSMSDGAIRYNPNAKSNNPLQYFTIDDGLPGNTAVDFAEDKAGNVWIATHDGLSRFDGTHFTKYTTADGLIHHRVSNLLVDAKGQLWIGTWGGISLFDGKTFTDFDVPVPPVALKSYQTTMDWVTELMEDSHGNIWIGRDGYGAARYDGKSFTHFTKEQGLPSNNVQSILEDRHGNIWISTRVVETDHPDQDKRFGPGGLIQFVANEKGEIHPSNAIQFPDTEGLHHNSIYSLLEDKSGNIWIGATGLGLYRYDGQEFTLFKGTDRMDLTWSLGYQGLFEDPNGTIWMGMSGGLFKLTDEGVIHQPKKGLWMW